MMRELRYGIAALGRRSARRRLAGLLLWSVPEILPTALFGVAVAHATDAFLAGQLGLGLAWLAGLVVAAGVGGVGARQVYRSLGRLVEPFRDDLVRHVVAGALARSSAGRADGGAVARLNRQVEIVRDSFGGLVLSVRGFVITVLGVLTGLLSLDPLIAVLVLVPFLLGFTASFAVLGPAARRLLRSIQADEDLTTAAGSVFAAVRDVTGSGAEDYAADLVGAPTEAHARAERAQARIAALRMACFAVGGWLPLLILLGAGPWLVSRGLTPGVLLGGLTYVLLGLQPALNTMLSALGDSGLRYVVTLGRILDAGPPPARPAEQVPGDPELIFDRVTFAYGPHAEPILDRLDLTVGPGDHLAVVGPSGAGKSTLTALACGLLRPTDGRVMLGGVPPAAVSPALLAGCRVLIPQEAYVFSGRLIDNLAYLRPEATPAQVAAAAAELGATELVDRLGGLAAELRPGDLSAGERQLIALVRAYLSPAPLAVLDEATCHLDPEAERRAEEAFAARGPLIVVAHRMTSALRAKRILVLDGERTVLGDHDSLLQRSPLYRDLIGFWQPPASADRYVASSG
ncbi:ATP-binding cassette domain-containing protein [Microlunatus parietis]|uniref:ATP-binding cassette subfamily C protein n=1 Tax=Microlunatus parietis TaxID=682979 RepID=A0A7Y9I4J0_9ACTN|nr:ABC transporter ATP-binding protein [Microlunatus parietis]NYE70151.1 ATP-binding cassette subfamily C protein [Microlunatus parietis]